MLLETLSNGSIFIFLIVIYIFIYFVFLKSKIDTAQNSKNVYHSSVQNMDTTYGTQKKEAEESAQGAKDVWDSTMRYIYKIIIETLLASIFVTFNVFNSVNKPLVTLGTNLIIILFFILELFISTFDDGLIKLFYSIETSAEKNTKDTGEHHKLLSIFLTSVISLISVLGIFRYKNDIFITSFWVSVILLFLTVFNISVLSSSIGYFFMVICILSFLAQFVYKNNIFLLSGIASLVLTILSFIQAVPVYAIFGLSCFCSSIGYILQKTPLFLTGAIISLILTILTLFNISFLDSDQYIFILFFLANIPIVSLFLYEFKLQDPKNNTIYVPLLIAFYILSIIMLTVLGIVDINSNSNLYTILPLIAFSFLYYARSLENSIYKTFLFVMAMILFFFITLQYLVVSQKWIIYLVAFFLLMYSIVKRVPLPSIGTSIQQVNNKITSREITLLSVEVVIIILYVYIRSMAKSIYTKHGKLIINQPVSLQEVTVVKIDKNSKYNYGLSFWVFINPMNPSSKPQATTFTSIFSYGDKPYISYNSTKQSMRIGMKTDSGVIKKVDEIETIPLQKWNHIVLNYGNGTCDVFVNGELHGTKIEIIPVKDVDTLVIGDDDGIDGKMCNIIFFKNQLTSTKIKQLYNEFAYKNPPTM